MTESAGQSNNSETIEKAGRKCLLVDDQPRIVRGMNRFFGELGNFTAVECHNVEDALNAIKANSPKILFLDHSLTPGGAEGLIIADKVKEMNPEIEIYSTTTNDDVLKQYKQRGIKHIDKNDLKGVEIVISGE